MEEKEEGDSDNNNSSGGAAEEIMMSSFMQNLRGCSPSTGQPVESLPNEYWNSL